MRRWFIVILMLLPLFIIRPVQAQSSTEINSLEVDLWPEYDHPDVLVIYHLTLAPQTTLPARLSLRIPKGVAKPSNLAMKDVDGSLYNIEAYTITPAGAWQTINFSSPSLEVQLEYYDPSINRSTAERSYVYTWPGDYAVNDLTFQVQQPIDSTNMQIRPDMGNGRVSSDGLTYYNNVVGQIMAGSQFTVQINYIKTNDKLSFTPSTVGPIDPITQQSAGRTSFMDVLPWILGVLGIFLIGGGLFWYWQAGRSSPMPERRRQNRFTAVNARFQTWSRPSETSAATTPAGQAKQIYCHQCGKAAMNGDIFCRSCGTRLRRE
ncbi:MAG TPA: zinc ribbon domain-containing protein [Anaerolineaceae bacterium]|nr:zinc ribbon domain-containing protein [Anaerolineaceae bacterium]